MYFTSLALLIQPVEASPRVEIPLSDANDVDLIPAASGAVLFTQARGQRRGYTVTGYDLDLQTTWSRDLVLDRTHHEVDKTSDADFAWMLLRRGWESLVLRTDVRTGEMLLTPVHPLSKSTVFEIASDGAGGAWVAGAHRKQGTLTWVTPTGTSRTVEIGRKLIVTDVTPAGPGRAQAAVREWRPYPGTPLEVLDLVDGAITRRVEVFPDPNLSLLTGRVAPVTDGEIAVGTWQPTGMFGGAEGLYVAKLSDGQQTSFQALPFSELDHPLAFLGERREMRIEERQEKRKERGKKNRIRWNLLLHDPVPIPDGFVIVAEAYQPAFQTRQETITVSDGRGGTRTSTRTYQEFIGWSFSHALVVGFDEEGHHRFDHSLRLSSGLSPTLQEHVRVLPDAHGLTLLYPQHRVLRTARIEGDQLLEEGEPVSLSTDVSVKRNLSADAAWWHDDVFLMHGVDRIGPPRGRARRVFFLSTLELMQ